MRRATRLGRPSTAAELSEYANARDRALAAEVQRRDQAFIQRSGLAVVKRRTDVSIRALAERVEALTADLAAERAATTAWLSEFEEKFEAWIAALPDEVRKHAGSLLVKSGLAERHGAVLKRATPEPPKATRKRKIIRRDANNRISEVIEVEMPDDGDGNGRLHD